MTSSSQHLEAAKAARDDEFYTPREMIEAELQNYPVDLFKGKAVLCNCDDPGEDKDDPRMSEFFRYFDLRFADLGLRKLVGTRYSGSSLFPGISGAKAYYRTVTQDKNGNKHGHPRRDLRNLGKTAAKLKGTTAASFADGATTPNGQNDNRPRCRIISAELAVSPKRLRLFPDMRALTACKTPLCEWGG